MVLIPLTKILDDQTIYINPLHIVNMTNLPEDEGGPGSQIIIFAFMTPVILRVRQTPDVIHKIIMDEFKGIARSWIGESKYIR